MDITPTIRQEAMTIRSKVEVMEEAMAEEAVTMDIEAEAMLVAVVMDKDTKGIEEVMVKVMVKGIKDIRSIKGDTVIKQPLPPTLGILGRASQLKQHFGEFVIDAKSLATGLMNAGLHLPCPWRVARKQKKTTIRV